MTRDGNPVLGRKVDWGRLLLHYGNTEEKTHLKMHGHHIATSSRINSIQAIQMNWIYQIMLEIYLFFQAVEHFVICAYRTSWNLGWGGWRKRGKRRGKICACVHKTSSAEPPQISSFYRIQMKVQVSLLFYLDLFAHHASQKYMYFYWLPLATPLYSALLLHCCIDFFCPTHTIDFPCSCYTSPMLLSASCLM